MGKTFDIFRRYYTSISLLGVLYLKLTSSFVHDSDLFPYLESSGSTSFSFNDDEHTQVNLKLGRFKFLGSVYDKVFVNGNGAITFVSGSGSYNYQCDKNRTALPTISVFMSDAATHGNTTTSKVLHREDITTASLNKVSKDVFAAFPSLSFISLHWMLIVTWYEITPISEAYKNRRNTYQAILTSDTSSSYSFVLFYYNNITWAAPRDDVTAAGHAGIFGGRYNLENSYLIPNSCNFSLINIAGMSNIDSPGKFVFRVDNSLVLPSVFKCVPKLTNISSDIVSIKPAVVPVIGSVPLLISGFNICLDHNVTKVSCKFSNKYQQSKAIMVGSMLPGQLAIICPTPIFYSLGRWIVSAYIWFSNGDSVNILGFIHVVKSANDANAEFNAVMMPQNKVFIKGLWNPMKFRMAEIELFFKANVNRDFPTITDYVNITLMELRGLQWKELHTFKNIRNKGNWVDTDTILPEIIGHELLSDKLETPPRAFKISSMFQMENGHEIWIEHVSDIADTTFILGKLKTFQNRNQTNIYDKRCKQWYDHEPAPPKDALPCPITLQQALADWRFLKDEMSASKTMNPLNFTIFIQSTASSSGAGSQCSYNRQGGLEIGFPYGNRLNRRNPNDPNDYWSHFWDDILPYQQCCQLSFNKEENCKKYFFTKRPSHDGSSYKTPVPFRVIGATHISTLDGAVYLLNGVGTFWLVKYGENFEMQILLETLAGPTIKNSTTVVTGAVMRNSWGNKNNSAAQFQVFAEPSCGLLIKMDDKPLNYLFDSDNKKIEGKNDNYTLYHSGVTVSISGTREALFSFSFGFSVKFILSAGNQSLNLVGSASETLRGNVNGLLGNFDGDAENDIVTTNGTILSNNNSLDQTFSDFVVTQWLVSKNESLFSFPPGKDYQFYNNRHGFQGYQFSRDHILKLTPGFVAGYCGNCDDCRIDYQLTDNQQFAHSTLLAYREFEKLQHISREVIYPTRKCLPPTQVSNGGFSSTHDNFSLGTIIQPFCNSGYDLHIRNDQGKILKANTVNFTCVPEELVVGGNQKSSIWMSLMVPLSQPLKNYNIECLSTATKKKMMKSVNTIKVDPQVVNEMTNVPLKLTVNYKLEADHIVDIVCSFGAPKKKAIIFEAKGAIITEESSNFTKIICPSENLTILGKIRIKLIINYLSSPSMYFEGIVWVQKSMDNYSHTSLQNAEIWDDWLVTNDFEGVMNHAKECKEWYDNQEKYNHLNVLDVFPCPRSVAQAEIDWRFTVTPETELYGTGMGYLIPDGATVYVHSTPSIISNSGFHCVYDRNGSLMYGSPTGSVIQQFSPYSLENGGNHLTHDIMPYTHCCRWNLNRKTDCRKFYQKMGIMSLKIGKEYTPPKFAHALGTNHVETFDGAKYQLNSAGEYWMIKQENLKFYGQKWNFYCQVRLEPYVSVSKSDNTQENNKTVKASVITALAMEQTWNEEKATIQVSRNIGSRKIFDIFVDGDLVEADKLRTLHHEGFTIFFSEDYASSTELIIAFRLGFSFKFTYSGEKEPGMNVIFSASSELMNTTAGLLGDFDGDKSNDFKTSAGTVLPENATLNSIYYDFAMNWLVIDDNQSIFSNYPDGLSNLHFYQPFPEPVAFLDIFKMHVGNAIQFCENSTECMFDFLATGSERFARAAKMSLEYFQGIVQTSETTVNECPPLDEIKGVSFLAHSLAFGSTLQAICDNVDNKNTRSINSSSTTYTCVKLANATFKWIQSPSDNGRDAYFINSCSSGEILVTNVMGNDNESKSSLNSITVLILVIIIVFLVIGVVTLLYKLYMLRKLVYNRAMTVATPLYGAGNLLELDDYFPK